MEKRILDYFRSKDRQMGGKWLDVSNKYYSAHILVFEEGSKWGINGGKISKMWVYKRGTTDIVINYDRGWDLMPGDFYSKQFYQNIVKKYN